MPASSYLVIQTAADKSLMPQPSGAGVQNYATPSSPQPGLAGQSGRGASVVSHCHQNSQGIAWSLYWVNVVSVEKSRDMKTVQHSAG